VEFESAVIKSMKFHNLLLTCFAAVLLKLASASAGEVLGLRGKLSTSTLEQAEMVLSSLSSNDSAAVSELCGFLADPTVKDFTHTNHLIACNVMELLGKWRVPQGVDAILPLIENFPPLGAFFGGKSEPEDYCTVRALIAIGMPSVQPVLRQARGLRADRGPEGQAMVITTNAMTKQTSTIIKIPKQTFVRIKLGLYAAVLRGVLGEDQASLFVRQAAEQDDELAGLARVFTERYPPTPNP